MLLLLRLLLLSLLLLLLLLPRQGVDARPAGLPLAELGLLCLPLLDLALVEERVKGAGGGVHCRVQQRGIPQLLLHGLTRRRRGLHRGRNDGGRRVLRRTASPALNNGRLAY